MATAARDWSFLFPVTAAHVVGVASATCYELLLQHPTRRREL